MRIYFIFLLLYSADRIFVIIMLCIYHIINVLRRVLCNFSASLFMRSVHTVIIFNLNNILSFLLRYSRYRGIVYKVLYTKRIVLQML